MRKRWLILAALAGALATAVAAKWPDRPRWRIAPGPCCLGGFSPDGQTVVTFCPHPNMGYPPGKMPVVSRWDAATGALLSRAELLCAEPNSYREAYPSADGRLALVRESFPGTDPATVFGNHYLHDAVTGRRIAGPISQLRVAHPGAFSPDNRWFSGWSMTSLGNNQWSSRLLLFDAKTGEQVLELSGQDRASFPCVFAPDGATMAVSWIPRDEKPRDAGLTVQILGLPSGRELRRIDLPPRQSLKRWDGRYLEVHVLTQTEQRNVTLLDSRVYDLASDPVGEGVEHPLLKGQVGGDPWITWSAGPDWVAQHERVRESGPSPWYERGLDQLASAAGFGSPFGGGIRGYVRILDRATGTVRHEFPQPVRDPWTVAPDGRLLVCGSDDGRLEAWDTEPRPPRWPWALAAGIVASGGVLALGRWRRRVELTRSPQVLPLCSHNPTASGRS